MRRKIHTISSIMFMGLRPGAPWQGKERSPQVTVLFGDINAFATYKSNPCTLRNRFKKVNSLDSVSMPLTEVEAKEASLDHSAHQLRWKNF